jgi:uncharacterized membrane protein
MSATGGGAIKGDEMNTRMKVTAGALGASLIFSATVTGIAVPASAAGSTNYACFNYGGAPQQLTSKSNPKNCNGIYKISKDGKVVASIDNRKIKNWTQFVAAVNRGNKSAQKWCSDNSLSCGVLTSIGSLLLGGVLKKTIEG